ncbi:MAG TPA: hypothetical protein EYQ69_03595 [Gemmatimonadetes bacterium]|nr:hypothetical protein [Gemmatimonadota bacterium]
MSRTFSINVLKEAKKQIREARDNGELDDLNEDGETWEPKCSKEINHDVLYDLKQSRKDKGDTFRQTKRKLSMNRRRERVEQGDFRVEWNFEPGMLVTISVRAGRRLSHLEAGMTGIIVESDDNSWSSSKNRLLTVMGPNGMEQWDASWVTIEDED